jgi:WD40 repeat protein
MLATRAALMALGIAFAAGAVAADEPKLLATLGKANPPYSRNAVFSPDGRTLATCGNGDLTLYDPTTHQVIASLEIERGGNERLAYSPDGKRIATTQEEDGEATVFDPANLKGPVLTLTPPKAKRTPQDLRRVVYSPDG